jgi:hypothetical protein
VVVTFVWLIMVMSTVFYKVLKQERTLDKYRGEAAESRKNSRKIANQAAFYVLAFAFPWMWGLILFSMDNPEKVFESETWENALTALSIVNAVIFPLQVSTNDLSVLNSSFLCRVS